MKPFNLEAALRGEKVVTRDGREVTQLVKFDGEYDHPLAAMVEGSIESYTLGGKYFSDGGEANFDLFMYEKTAIWKPSACCSLRWFKPQVGSPRLQQMYVNQLKPEYEWRDVPIVQEDPDV